MQIKETLNQLARSNRDQLIGGVCAGFAETSDTPAWVWRAGAAAAALCFGVGLPVYLLLWYFMPLRQGSVPDSSAR